MSKSNIAVAATVALLLAAGAQAAPDTYSVAKLLEPCMSGDNDSREGTVLELECEQYISGFTDAYILLRDAGKADGVCLPGENRADEVRWAFMRWAHRHFSERAMPAADGLLAVIKEGFRCP